METLRRRVLLGALCLLAAPPSDARGDTSGHAYQFVYVEVVPTLLIGESNGTIALGRVGTGEICATVRWRIEANEDVARFVLGASDLWKGGDPRSPVPPIPLRHARGVTMDLDSGSPVRGQDGELAFVSQTRVHEYPVWVTEPVVFESAQSHRFSQYLTTTLCWTQNDPEKPRGTYGGAVNLWAVLVPKFY
jgi:hypothetical protein